IATPSPPAKTVVNAAIRSTVPNPRRKRGSVSIVKTPISITMKTHHSWQDYVRRNFLSAMLSHLDTGGFLLETEEGSGALLGPPSVHSLDHHLLLQCCDEHQHIVLAPEFRRKTA